LTDHLGSASLATNTSGGTVANSAQRYKPFGEVRVAGSGQPSKFTFTGQYDFMSFGIMDYGARPYSPLLGRFLSADTVVPGAGNPQALNRYAYVLNRPLNMVDPTGHAQISPEGGGCSETMSPWLCSSNKIRAANEAKLKQTRRTPGGELAKSANAQTPLAQKLIDWHVQERGTLVLTKDEVMETNPVFDLRIDTNFKDVRGNLTKREGGKKHIKSSVLGEAWAAGTLGRYTLRYDGDLEVNPDGSWSFEGTATVFDTWDFNILPLRPMIESEAKTIVGNILLGSYSYDIYSEPLRVSQSKGQNVLLFPEYPGYTPTHIKNAEADSEFH
jgi:RHS repeat-associated protein